MVVRPRLTRRPAAHRETAQDEGALGLRARRTAIVALVVIRVATAAVLLALGLLAHDLDLRIHLPLVAGALLEIGWTGWLLWLLGATGTRLAFGALLLDIAFLTASVQESGGPDSAALLLFMVLPLAGALVLTPQQLIALAAIVGLVRIAIGGPSSEILAFLVAGTWAVTLGVIAADIRMRFLRRLDGLDAVYDAFVPARARLAVRARVADELRFVAVEPLAAIRADAAAAAADETTPDAAFTRLAERVAEVGESTRSALYELHAMSGLTGPLPSRIRRLAQRRAPGCEVDVAVDPEVADDLAEPLGALVRESLSLIVGRATRTVTVSVRAVPYGAELTVTGTPAATLEEPTRRLRWAAIQARAGVDRARQDETHDGRRIVLCLRGLPESALSGSVIPGRLLPSTGVTIVVANVGFIVAALGAGAFIGGTRSGFWPVGLVTLAVVSPICAVLVRPRRSWPYAAGSLIATAGVLLVFHTLGHEGQEAIAPAVLMLGASSAAVFRTPIVALIVVALGAGVAAAGTAPGPGWPIVVFYALAVAVCDAEARGAARAMYAGTMRRRARLLEGLIDVESRERRRIAGQLHDDVLQLLLVARQDLEEAGRGDREAVPLALRSLELADASLGQTATELDVDEGAASLGGGLRDALGLVASRRGGPPVAISVDEAAEGQHDGLVVQLARELYVNAVKHASATRIVIRVTARPGGLLLEVTDDGIGFDDRVALTALEQGHIGLATVRERAAAHGGSTAIATADAGGARVVVWLPARPVSETVRPA